MWKVKNTEKLIENRWLTVRKESVDLPSGEHIDDFYSVTDAAAIVAVTEDRKIVLKKEYKYATGEELIEVPTGMFEPEENEGLSVAKRELLEKTGYTRRRMIFFLLLILTVIVEVSLLKIKMVNISFSAVMKLVCFS